MNLSNKLVGSKGDEFGDRFRTKYKKRSVEARISRGDHGGLQRSFTALGCFAGWVPKML